MMIILRAVVLASVVAVVGCSAIPTSEPIPTPVKMAFSGTLNGDLTLYGDPAAPAPNPNVQIAGIAANALTRGLGIYYGAQVATDIAGTIAGAAKVVPVTSSTQSVQAVKPQVVQTAGPTQVVQPEVVRPQVVDPVVVPQPVQVVNPVVIETPAPQTSGTQ